MNPATCSPVRIRTWIKEVEAPYVNPLHYGTKKSHFKTIKVQLVCYVVHFIVVRERIELSLPGWKPGFLATRRTDQSSGYSIGMFHHLIRERVYCPCSHGYRFITSTITKKTIGFSRQPNKTSSYFVTLILGVCDLNSEKELYYLHPHFFKTWDPHPTLNLYFVLLSVFCTWGGTWTRTGVMPNRFSYHYSFHYHFCLWSGLYLNHI
jgi:hypothetical protein